MLFPTNKDLNAVSYAVVRWTTVRQEMLAVCGFQTIQSALSPQFRRLKPRPHQRQCRQKRRHCRQHCVFGNNVAGFGDNVAVFGYNVAVFGDIVAGVDGALVDETAD